MTDTELRVRPGDFLSVSLTGKHFHFKVRRLTTDETLKRSSERFNINGRVHYEYCETPRDMMSFLRKLPEGQWDKKTQCYRTPLTDTVALMVDRNWPRSNVTFNSGACSGIFDELLAKFDIGRGVAVQSARFKAEGIVPTLPHYWQEKADTPLSDYQRTAVKLALDSSEFALFMDRGTGKTACSVQYACSVAQMVNEGLCEGGVPTPEGSRMIRILVVVPKNVRLNWQREFTKFAHVKGKVSVLRGGLPKRVKCVADAISPSPDCKFSALIAGYDGVRTTEDYLKLVNWDIIITDESHYYKSSQTDRYKSLRNLRDCSNRRLSLTGTPIGNSPMDLWSQLEFLREGLSGFSSFKAFKDYHGIWQRTIGTVQGIQKLVGLQNIPFLQERLSQCSFSVTKKEAGLNLPDKVYSVREVELTKEQKFFYKKLEDELAIEIEDKLSGKVVDQVTVTNVLTMLLRLAQITSGYITYDAQFDDDGETVVPKRIEDIGTLNPKADEVMELLQVDRDPRSKTIIWCHFIHNIEILSDRLTEADIGHVVYYGAVNADARDRNVDAFNNDPECKVFIGNPATAGEGLNLLGYDTTCPDVSDTNCDMEIFYSQGWSAILRGQAEDRAHRRGTRSSLEIIDLVAPNTIDEEILDRVQEKITMAETVTDLLPILKRVLVNQ